MYDLFNNANKLSFLRIILSIIFSIGLCDLYINNNKISIILLILFIIISLTDIFDGKIARKNNLTSSFGSKLDVIADITFVLLSYIVLVYVNKIPSWFLILTIIVFSEFILTSSILANNKDKSLIFDKIGKYFGVICMTIPGMVLFSNIINCNYIVNIIIIITSIMGIISFISRLVKCYKIKKLD